MIDPVRKKGQDYIKQLDPFVQEHLIYDERGDKVFCFWRKVIGSSGFWIYSFYDGPLLLVHHVKGV